MGFAGSGAGGGGADLGAPTFGMIGVLNGPVATPAATARAGPPLEAVGLAPAPVQTRLDPNARYVTTYRSRGAALAAFDAAVSRGQIPGTYKDLVGDFGARYAPALAAPTDGALAVSVDTERAAIGPNGGSTNLVVSLASSEAMPSRAPLSVHIVLDVSGSMSGQAIEDAKHAAEAAVDKLEPTDDFSMVTFSNTRAGARSRRRHRTAPAPSARPHSRGARRRRDQHLVGPRPRLRRSAHARSVGRRRRPDQFPRSCPTATPTRVTRILPQSLPRRGARLSKTASRRACFGLGPDFDGAAHERDRRHRGAGGYYYLADSSQIGLALAREIDARVCNRWPPPWNCGCVFGRTFPRHTRSAPVSYRPRRLPPYAPKK